MFKKKIYSTFLLTTIFVLLFSSSSINSDKEEIVQITDLEIETSKSNNELKNNIEFSKNSISDRNAKTITETKAFIAENPSNNSFVFSNGSFNENDIKELFKLKRAEIESMIGSDYETSETGAEQSFTAYTYKKHDVSIFYTMYDSMNDYVDFIECGNTINIYGLYIGMTFDEIRAIIPNTEIKKWSPEEDNDIVYYQIECTKDNLKIRFKINSEDSPSTSMTINMKTKADSNNVEPIKDNDLQISKYKLDMTLEDFEKVMPNDLKEKISSYDDALEMQQVIYLFRDGTEFVFTENELYSITTTNTNYQTPRGLGVGDSIAKLVELYGNPQHISDNCWGYNYEGGEDYTVFSVTVVNKKVYKIEMSLVM